MTVRAPRSVALVKLSALGDVVHALPVAGAVRARWPGARLTWIVERRNAVVVRDHPGVDEVIAVDTKAWRRARRPRDLRGVVRELATLRGRFRAARFDVALDLQGLVKSGMLVAATGAPVRVGFSMLHCRERLNALFTTHHVDVPPDAAHVVEQYLSILDAFGRAPTGRVEFPLPWSAEAEATIEDFFVSAGLKPRDRVVVLNPGAGRPEKRWPAERFAELGRRLCRERVARVVLVWGPGEADLAHRIVEEHTGVVLAPPTDLRRLLAVLRRASVLVAADTGPLHVAAALGLPCVGLFGPTSSVRNGPYGKGHRTFQAAHGHLEEIDVDPVLAAVAELLG